MNIENGAKSAQEVHAKRNKLWDAILDNHRKFIDADTGLFKQELLEDRNCPACSDEASIVLFQKCELL